MALRVGHVHVPLKLGVRQLKQFAGLGCDKDWPAIVSKALAAGVSNLPAEAVADAVQLAAERTDKAWLEQALTVFRDEGRIGNAATAA